MIQSAFAHPLTSNDAAPRQPLVHLDTLWLQIAGTVCNLRCTHCFVSAGPGDDRHAFMSREQVRSHLEDALRLGVNDVYLTGGEPFLHPELFPIMADVLAETPCTVLTNGTLLTSDRLRELRRMSDASPRSLEIRVSLDGESAEAHDRVRGHGTFAIALRGLRGLEAHGVLPIVTATIPAGDDEDATRERYESMLRSAGIVRPRIKLLPTFRLGRASAAGIHDERLTLSDTDTTRLPCASCRAVSSQGVFVCPLLVDEPTGRMGDRLAQALGPFPLAHSACVTCYATGSTCSNGT